MKVAANENCLAEFNELKFKKNHRYIVFRICNEKDKEAIVIEMRFRLLSEKERENKPGIIS